MNALELLTRAFANRHDDAGTDDGTANRVLDAALRQLELFGIQRTTMEDIARRSGVSRVTVYRHFPNKDRLLEAVVLREVQRFLAALAAVGDAQASEEDRIVEGFVFVVRELRGHTLLQQLLQGEPELFLPQLTTEAGPMIAFARQLIADHVAARYRTGFSHEELVVGAEIGIRLTLSLILTPDSAIDLEDTDRLRRVARRYLAPFVDGEVLRLVKSKSKSPSKSSTTGR